VAVVQSLLDRDPVPVEDLVAQVKAGGRFIPVPVASMPPRTLGRRPSVEAVASAPISESRVGPAATALSRWAAYRSGGSPFRARTWTPIEPRWSATGSRVVAGLAAWAQTSAPFSTNASKYGTVLTSRWQTTRSRSPLREGRSRAASRVAGVKARSQARSLCGSSCPFVGRAPFGLCVGGRYSI